MREIGAIEPVPRFPALSVSNPVRLSTANARLNPKPPATVDAVWSASVEDVINADDVRAGCFPIPKSADESESGLKDSSCDCQLERKLAGVGGTAMK
jgi:hypothetical protein